MASILTRPTRKSTHAIDNMTHVSWLYASIMHAGSLVRLTGAAKCDRAIINVMSYTSLSPATTSQKAVKNVYKYYCRLGSCL